jgi:hypothetical protein
MVRRLAVVLVVVGAFGPVGLGAVPAGASCVGPRVTVVPAEFARGDRVTISGQFWGDACNDMRFPGQNDPVLGDPVAKITINFVQGGIRIPVARGAADKRYEFEVLVRVPASLAPGSVDLMATGHFLGNDDDNDVPAGRLRITDAVPTHVARKVKVVKFGP